MSLEKRTRLAASTKSERNGNGTLSASAHPEESGLPVPESGALKITDTAAGEREPHGSLDKSLDKEVTLSVHKEINDIPAGCTRVLVKERLNNARYLNKFLENINRNMVCGGELVCFVEINEQRNERMKSRYPLYWNFGGRFLDFSVNRVLPKLSVTQTLYFSITKGFDRPVSLPEALGRLISCGYRVETFDAVEGLIRITAQKTGDPVYNNRASYGFLIRLTRVGRNGEDVDIYKFRTMHPYSEYLQDYIFQMNNLKHGGKFKDDFRVTTWGRWLRKFWLDEQPMWINFFKGEMKLVGVRPLSRHYFELYPKEMQEYRARFKPGLFPPFYADLPDTFEEIVDSERRYLQQYEKSPVRTDIRYILKIFKNIFIRRARSS